MLVRSILRYSVIDAGKLYFEPLVKPFVRRRADYRDLAARDFLWEIHDLAAAVADGKAAGDLGVNVRTALRTAEKFLGVDVMRDLDLSRFAERLINAHSSDHHLFVHAAFICGYVAALAKQASMPARFVRTGNAFFEVHSELVELNRKISKPSAVNIA